MNTIYDGSFVLGQTSATNFQAGQGIKIDEPSEGTVRIAALLPKTYEYVTNVTAAKSSGFSNWACCQLSATIPDGYVFGCWCNVASQGWGGACYAEFPKQAVTNCWNPCRAENITTAKQVRAAYIVLPSGSNA